MGKEIISLQPTCVWEKFYEITQIPHPSAHEAMILDYVESFAQRLGLQTVRGANHYIIVRKPASAGCEQRQSVALQAHIDMVPQKLPEKNHDFLTDPIQTIIDNGWVRADGTTLGSDDGIGVAAALALLESKTIKHGPIEVLFTTEEETLMAGANALEPNILRSKILFNLDYEQEGDICIGGAGGLDLKARFNFTKIETADDDIAFRVTVSGLNGGHSGLDINLGRANAIKLLVRFLKFAAANYESMLSSIDGGSLHNAIPREASAVITIDAEDKADFIEAVEEFEDTLREEYSNTEPSLSFTATLTDTPSVVIDEMTTDDIINAIQGCPNGVIRMNSMVDGVVDSSTNISTIVSTENYVDVTLLVRSIYDSEKEDIASSVESVFRLAGAEMEFGASYPSWNQSNEFPLLLKAKEVYRKLFDTEANTVVMHAGLECGIFADSYPEMSIISFGPTLKYPHSPSEKVNIESVGRFWQFLTELIESV